MADITLIRPHCSEKSKTKRLDGILEYSLKGHSYETITTAGEFKNLRRKKILFAISLGESGINLEHYGILKRIRQERSCFEGSVGGIILDGCTELFTKSVGRELVFSANQSGCTFPGKGLVEGTGSLRNFNVSARNLELDHLEAYMYSSRELVNKIADFDPPKSDHPNILVLHAGNYSRSNTLDLWKLVERHLEDCSVTEISLKNGAVLDCIGCPYTTCKYFGESGNCIYGGVIVDQVYPAILECDALVMICPNYNDAVSANLAAFINRLTALLKMTSFYDKYLFGLIVSGYSGGDLVAQQLISGLNMNKTFVLPSRFAMLETANDPGSLLKMEGIEDRAAAFAHQIRDAIYSRG